MIVKDNRSPRGRHEPDILRRNPAYLQPIGTGGSMEPGTSWRTMMGDGTGQSYLFRKHPEPREPRPRALVTVRCEQCSAAFLTANPTLARHCGATCRKRAQRARRAA